MELVIPSKLHLDGECTYHECTLAEGHEVCREVWNWLGDLRAAIVSGDIEKAQEINRRMK